MNTPSYSPMNGPMNAQTMPQHIMRRAKPLDPPVRPGQVLRYLVGLLAAWTATIFACRDVVTASKSGSATSTSNLVALALAALSGAMALFWIVLASRKFSKKPQQSSDQPPMGAYPDANVAPAAPRGAAPGMPMPSRPMPGRPAGPPVSGTYGGNGDPTPDGYAPSDQGDSGKIPAVAAYQGSQFLSDPLFTLEVPRPPARLFQAQKDKNNLCQDSFSCDSQHEIYVVTDGVTGSLMSAPWARLVAREYVTFKRHLQDPFQQEDIFRIWLSSCMHQWRDWMYDTRASMLGTTGGNTVKTASVPWEKSIDYWHERVNSKPAQTTAVTCSIQRDGVGRDRAILHVSAIGDSECLVFRPDRHGAPQLQTAFPLTRQEEFNDHPDTLTTDIVDANIHTMYKNIRHREFEVRKGDIAVLATDSVAQWLLHMSSLEIPQQPMQPAPPSLREVLNFANQEEFARFVEQECAAGRLERDDETLLIIPIS